MVRSGARRRRLVSRATNVARADLAALVLVPLLTAGCVPSVTHSPRVDPGLSGSIDIGLPELGRQSNVPFVFSPANAQLAYGWRDDSTGAGLRVAAGVGSILQLDGDAYVELPRRALGGLDGGIGVAGLWPSLRGATPMPYVDVGVLRSGSGPYLTLGYVHETVDTTRVEDPLVLHADGWQTTVAYQVRSGSLALRPFVASVIGKHFSESCAGKSFSCAGRPRPWAVLIGLSVEQFREP